MSVLRVRETTPVIYEPRDGTLRIGGPSNPYGSTPAWRVHDTDRPDTGGSGPYQRVYSGVLLDPDDAGGPLLVNMLSALGEASVRRWLATAPGNLPATAEVEWRSESISACRRMLAAAATMAEHRLRTSYPSDPGMLLVVVDHPGLMDDPVSVDLATELVRTGRKVGIGLMLRVAQLWVLAFGGSSTLRSCAAAGNLAVLGHRLDKPTEALLAEIGGHEISGQQSPSGLAETSGERRG